MPRARPRTNSIRSIVRDINQNMGLVSTYYGIAVSAANTAIASSAGAALAVHHNTRSNDDVANVFFLFRLTRYDSVTQQISSQNFNYFQFESL